MRPRSGGVRGGADSVREGVNVVGRGASQRTAPFPAAGTGGVYAPDGARRGHAVTVSRRRHGQARDREDSDMVLQKTLRAAHRLLPTSLCDATAGADAYRMKWLCRLFRQ